MKSSEELQTQDAFCLQRMDHALLQDVNFVYGIVPLFKGVIEGVGIRFSGLKVCGSSTD